MAATMNDTTISTLSLLESRILRIEHVLYGHSNTVPKTSAIQSMHELETRFAKLLQHIRVYSELLKLRT